MTCSDDILAQIDNALNDWTVSGDAMRWQPQPQPEESGFRGVGLQMWIADEAGEWQEITGVGPVQLHESEPPVSEECTRSWVQLAQRVREAEIERARQTAAAMEALATAMLPVMRAVHALAESLRQAITNAGGGEWADSNGGPAPGAPDEDRAARKPRRLRDRPAWQSPYGPARKRRH